MTHDLTNYVLNW